MRSCLYMTILQNLPKFADVVEECMDNFMASRSFKDPGAVGNEPIDTQVFASIAGVLHEYVGFLIHGWNTIYLSPQVPGPFQERSRDVSSLGTDGYEVASVVR